jgi:hypothetical protein
MSHHEKIDCVTAGYDSAKPRKICYIGSVPGTRER